MEPARKLEKDPEIYSKRGVSAHKDKVRRVAAANSTADGTPEWVVNGFKSRHVILALIGIVFGVVSFTNIQIVVGFAIWVVIGFATGYVVGFAISLVGWIVMEVHKRFATEFLLSILVPVRLLLRFSLCASVRIVLILPLRLPNGLLVCLPLELPVCMP